MDQLTTSHNFKFQISISNAILAGHLANKLVFTYDGDDHKHYECMKLWMINEDKVYNVYYFAREGEYSNSLPTVQRMIDSFGIGGLIGYTNATSGGTSYPYLIQTSLSYGIQIY